MSNNFVVVAKPFESSQGKTGVLMIISLHFRKYFRYITENRPGCFLVIQMIGSSYLVCSTLMGSSCPWFQTVVFSFPALDQTAFHGRGPKLGMWVIIINSSSWSYSSPVRYTRTIWLQMVREGWGWDNIGLPKDTYWVSCWSLSKGFPGWY